MPARDKYFKQLNKFLEKTGGTTLVGKSVTWADIVIADSLFNLHNLVPTLFDGYPMVKKLVDSVHKLPALKNYLTERPTAKF